MTRAGMEKLGFQHRYGEKYDKWCDGRLIQVWIKKEDSEQDVWNKIYDAIYKEGIDEGKAQKAEEIKKVLNLDV